MSEAPKDFAQAHASSGSPARVIADGAWSNGHAAGAGRSRVREGGNRKARHHASPVITDACLADLLADKIEGSIRYVSAWSKCFHFTGTVWGHERTNLVRDLTRQFCQGIAGEQGDDKSAVRIASSKTIAGVQTLALAHRDIAATVEQWDQDIFSLNTPTGVVNLRTGQIRPQCPTDYLTKITAVAPDANCPTPTWLTFLKRIFAEDDTLIAYLQRVFGYSLTGSTQEHSMFFGYGTGSNGKSVLLETVAGIMGDYHTTAPIETFTAASGDRHPTELARLVGARLVTAAETESGRRWAESRIKTLTGGDRVAARFMRQDFFEFKPKFKLFIIGNHKPVLRTVDEAIRRRLNMLPFGVTIPAEQRDPALAEKLASEWPGILQWMILGCVAWQEQGLAPPTAVTEATEKYLEAQDTVQSWLGECCDIGAKHKDTAANLYCSWKAYAESAGEVAGCSKALGEELEKVGFTAKRTKKARTLHGLMVKPTEPAEPHWTDR